MERCLTCPMLRDENKRLQAENRLLKAKLRRGRNKCQKLAWQAQDRMNEGNLPRPAWSYLKAMKETAEAIFYALV